MTRSKKQINVHLCSLIMAFVRYPRSVARAFASRTCKVQYSPFIMLYLGSIGMDRVIKGQFCKGIIGK